MPESQEPTSFYIRTQEGATFYVDTLEEALEAFIGNSGYRLTLSAGQKELVILRDSRWILDEFGTKTGGADLVYRERNQ